MHAIAATRLHVELTSTGADTFTVHATDPTGAPVITIETLTLRELPAGGGQLAAPASCATACLSWAGRRWSTPAPRRRSPWTGRFLPTNPIACRPACKAARCHTELATVTPAPELVIWALPLPEAADEDPLKRLHALTGRTLAHLQDWLARPETADTHLVVLTRHAVTTSAYDPPPDLAHAAAWALIHSAQNEHPGRITVIDTDDTAASDHNLVAAVARRPAGEPQLALRHGTLHIPRLTPSVTLTPPLTPAWKLDTTAKGDLTNLVLVETDPSAPLGAGQIRIQVRAAGLNFHDVVVALGAISDEGLGGRSGRGGHRDRRRCDIGAPG